MTTTFLFNESAIEFTKVFPTGMTDKYTTITACQEYMSNLYVQNQWLKICSVLFVLLVFAYLYYQHTKSTKE